MTRVKLSGDFMRQTLLMLSLMAVLYPASCSVVQKEKVFRNGAVVCADRIAAEVGLAVLMGGGNAIDAACATALALAATFPEAGNIGGGGFALIYYADSQEVYSIDFREKAPLAATADFYFDEAGSVDRNKILRGPSAAGVPGTVAGLFEMHRRFGRAQWRELVHPARMLCDTGFIVSEHLVKSLRQEAGIWGIFPSSAEIFMPGGNPLAAGDRLHQPDLGATLMAIGAYGRNGFYRGETAQRIADYCADNGGLITLDDLENYEPVWRNPVRFSFRRLDFFCAGLPSSGGVVMGQILGMLEPYELERYTADSPEYMHLFIEAARRAFADRSEYLGDPDFGPDLTGALLEKDYLLNRHKSIEVDHASTSAEILPGMPRNSRESDQTTHFVVADSSGNIVSLTYTINDAFGSGAVVPDCGFLLNNEMDDFAVKDGEPNMYGLTGKRANSIEPGKRMLSSMSPTIIFESGQPYLALGSPGGPKIITAVAQAVLNHRVYKMSLAEAVAFPRFHHQWQPDKVFVEQGGYSIDVIQKLIGMGHNVEEMPQYGEVMVLGFSQGGAFITGVADPRGAGYAAGF